MKGSQIEIMVSQQWHKIVALIMAKFGTTKIDFTLKEVKNFFEGDPMAVVISEHLGTLSVYLMSQRDAEIFQKTNHPEHPKWEDKKNV